MSNSPQVQAGFAEVNGTTLYYEVAGVGHPFVTRPWTPAGSTIVGRSVRCLREAVPGRPL